MTGWKTTGNKFSHNKKNLHGQLQNMTGTAKGKTWKAVGTNPATGKTMTIQGGQKGTKVGSANPQSEKSFDARHDATGMTPKKYVNKLRWDNKAEIGTTVRIPDRLFSKK